MSNILEVTFETGQTFVTATRLWQGDYGQILLIHGPELPSYYEVHFSSSKDGTPEVAVGTPAGVTIPNRFLRACGHIYAWVFLHVGNNDGETKFQVKIPVEERGIPVNQETPAEQTAVQQAIAALNEETGRAEAAADRAEQSEVNAKASEDAAALSEQNASGSAEAAASSERNAAQSELDAAASAAIAMDEASDATQAANAAIAAANTAEGAAGSVTEDARRAESAATHAEQYSDAAQIAKEAAVASEQAAERHKNDAVDAKEAAQSAASTATNMAQAAEDYAGVASQKAEVATDKALEANLSATDASGSASNAAISATQAEASATNAGNAETAAKNARDLAQGYASGANESKLAAQAAQEYSEVAQTAAETAQDKAEDAQDAAETAQGLAETAQGAAEDAALEAEGYAKGTQDGTTVESGSPYYQANAKYYKEQAAESAAAAAASAASLTVDDELSDTSTNPVQNKVITGEVKQTEHYALSAFSMDVVSGVIASFPDGADDMPLKSLAVAVEPVQSGSGDPSPDNVRPISGRSAVKVWRTGKNLFPGGIESKTHKEVAFSVAQDGTVTANGTATGGTAQTASSNNRFALQPGSYILTGCPSGGGSTTYELDIFGGAAQYRDYGEGKSFTITSTETQLYMAITIRNGVTADNLTFSPMIRLADADAGYEPYVGTTVTIDLDGTIYGGTLDVLTGVLTVDRVYMEFDGSVDENWIFNTNYYQISTPGSKSRGSGGFSSSNYFKPGPAGTNNVNVVTNFSRFYATGIAETLEAWRTWLGSHTVQLVYELSTPQTVQLTPEEVSTLLGENNVWADAGDVFVTYRADPSLYVNKKVSAAEQVMELIITANREDSMTATKAYVSGDLIIVGGKLYKATASIANGATLTVGTNVSQTTIAAEIAAINS